MSYIDNGNLAELIINGIKQQLANVHTNLIAKIVKVNDTTIDAQPVIARIVNNEEIPLPPFTKIPIINFLGGSSSIQMPIKVGDYCLLLVSERCFDDWYFGVDNKAPLIKRMHDYSDCLALVGLHNQSGELTIPEVITVVGDEKHTGDLEHIGDIKHEGNTKQRGNIEQEGSTKQKGDVSLTGDITHIGDLNITGNITVSGTIIAGGVTAGGLTIAPSGGSSAKAEINGDLNIKGGKLFVNGIDVVQRLNNHTHTAPQNGGTTSTPN